MAEVFDPLQTTWLTGCVSPGVGFTVMVNVCALPKQVFATGTTEIVARTGVFVLLEAVNDKILLLPLPDNPMEGLLLLQL